MRMWRFWVECVDSLRIKLKVPTCHFPYHFLFVYIYPTTWPIIYYGPLMDYLFILLGTHHFILINYNYIWGHQCLFKTVSDIKMRNDFCTFYAFILVDVI